MRQVGPIYAIVNVADDAVMSIPLATDPEELHMEWVCRYGNIEEHRFSIASVIESYEYLLSDYITADEAIRRLRLMRNACRIFKKDRAGE
jgi:hypothetical protein